MEMNRRQGTDNSLELDVGDGIIELTWVVHKYSERDDIVFDHLNLWVKTAGDD
jgi:hypothetical protein